MAMTQDTPYFYRTTIEPDDWYVPHLLMIAAEEHMLVAIDCTRDDYLTFTYYDPASMPRSPSIWGQLDGTPITWPEYMADDGPLIA